MAFGSSTFSLDAGCALTIDGGTATDLTFTTAHTNLVLVVKNLDCGTGGSCITFATLTGGSVNVNGLTRTIGPGAVTAGIYYVVLFNAAVSGTDISIVGVTLTLSSVTCGGNLGLYAVHAVSTVAGKNAAGSTFNVSSMRVTGSATSSGGSITMFVAYIVGSLTQFEKVEISGNDWSGVALSSPATTEILLFFGERRHPHRNGGEQHRHARQQR